MYANGSAKSNEAENNRSSTSRPADHAPPPLPPLLALQQSVGNAAVVQRLRQASHPGAQEGYRHSAGCGHQQAEPPVQRSTVPDVLRSPGRPLDDNTRTEMETRLGADFSDVRLHTDTAAEASAAEVGARAYTSGSHVVVGDGGADKHTLAHELTHVIQQRKGPVTGTDSGNGLKVSDPSDRFEREAEVNATRVMRAPMSELQHATSRIDERCNPKNQTQTYPGSGTVARAGLKTAPGPVVQRMPVEEFDKRVSDAYTAQEAEAAEQHAGEWSSEQWLSRFRQWLAAKFGVSMGDLDSHIVEGVTAETLAAELHIFSSESREFAHAESMRELEGSSRHDGPTFAPGTAGAKSPLNRKKPFWVWLRGDKDDVPARMNCWEAVLYAAYRDSLIDKKYISKAILRPTSDDPPLFAQKIFQSPVGELIKEEGRSVVEIEKDLLIPRGHVVIFGDAEHVALSTGDYGESGHGIYELDRGTPGITKTTIEEVIREKSFFGSKKVTWGRLPNLG